MDFVAIDFETATSKWTSICSMGICVVEDNKVKEVKEAEKVVEFKKEREPVGVCPWCGENLYKFEDWDKSANKLNYIRYYCSNKGVCSFGLSTNDSTVTTYTKKKLTEKQLQKLVAQGFIVLTCKSKFKGKEDYEGKFTIIRKEVGGKVYSNLACTPV